VKTPKRTITFIAARDPNYFRVASFLSACKSEFEVREITSNASSYPFRLVSVLSRLLLLALRRRNKGVLFVAFLAQPLIPFVRSLWRGPVVVDAFFSLYDSLVLDRGRVAPDSVIASISRYLDGALLSTATLVFTDTEAHQRYFKEEFSADSTTMQRVFIGASNKFLEHEYVSRWDEKSSFQVVFWGSFIPLQGVEYIIEAARRLENENVTFELIGRGQTKSEMLQQTRGLTNVTFVEWCEGDVLFERINRAQLALGIFGATDKAKRVIPNKVFEALAIGIPLVTADTEAARELLEDRRTAIFCQCSSGVVLAEAVRWARANYDEALSIGKAGRKLFRQRASLAVLQPEIVRALKNMIEGRERSGPSSNLSSSLRISG